MTSTYSQFDNNNQSPLPQQQGTVPIQQVGYGGNYNTAVQIQQPQYEVEGKFSWTNFIVSIVTLIFGTFCCCNPVTPVFAILGVVYSANSYSSHGDKAWERSRRQNQTARIFAIIAFVFLCVYTVIFISTLIVVFARSAPTTINTDINGK